MVLFAMFHFDGHRNRLLSYSDSSWSHHYTGFAREKKPALQQFHTLATDWTQEFSSWRSCPNHGTFYYNKNTKTDTRRCKGGRRVGHKTKAGMVTETSLFQQLLRQKRLFLVTSTVCFSMVYFLLPLAIGVMPQWVNRSSPLYGLPWGWWLAFAQIFMTWIWAWVYWWRAKTFDRMAEEIRKRSGR